MKRYNHGLTEPIIFLLELYKQNIGSCFIQELRHNDKLCSFIEDPEMFDYTFFDENWWPLFQFSDIGMCAMKYGGLQIIKAFSRLEGSDREKAEYYARIYSRNPEPIDTSDIYHIPDHVRNPKL